MHRTAGAPDSVLHHPPQAGSHGCRRWVFRRNLLQLIGGVHHAVQVQIRSSPADPDASTTRPATTHLRRRAAHASDGEHDGDAQQQARRPSAPTRTIQRPASLHRPLRPAPLPPQNPSTPFPSGTVRSSISPLPNPSAGVPTPLPFDPPHPIMASPPIASSQTSQQDLAIHVAVAPHLIQQRVGSIFSHPLHLIRPPCHHTAASTLANSVLRPPCRRQQPIDGEQRPSSTSNADSSEPISTPVMIQTATIFRPIQQSRGQAPPMSSIIRPHPKPWPTSQPSSTPSSRRQPTSTIPCVRRLSAHQQPRWPHDPTVHDFGPAAHVPLKWKQANQVRQR
ncbi:hypothetical protein ACLOJK_004136 [Asimina triloba]